MNSLKIPCNSFHPSALSSLHWVHKCLFKIKGATLIPQSMLIELAKRGRVAAQSQGSQAKRSASQTRHEAAKRAWCSTPKLVAWPDEKTYRREIQPRLRLVTISALSVALGVCESYAADIRSGRKCPHPRHWQELSRLVGVFDGRSSYKCGVDPIWLLETLFKFFNVK